MANMLFVGCGVPKRGMGWCHIYQAWKQMPKVNVCGVVEPFFLGAGAGSCPEFEDFRKESQDSFSWYDSVDSATVPENTVALLSARTADNAGFIEQLLRKGIRAIYLEKPGATSTAGLESIRDMCADAGVPCMMGYNKNGSDYIARTMAYVRSVQGPVNVTFEHTNAYTPETIQECFERNSEGMLRNMACHELALAVSLFDINSSTLKDVSVLKEASNMQTLGGFTDFDKLGFVLEAVNGTKVTIKASRMGGQGSVAYCGDQEFNVVTPEATAAAAQLEKDLPGMISYFYPQWGDYITLKNKITEHVAAGNSGLPAGVVTVDNGVEVMKLCDSLTTQFKKELAN